MGLQRGLRYTGLFSQESILLPKMLPLGLLKPRLLVVMCTACQSGLCGCGCAPVGHVLSKLINKQNPRCSLLTPVAHAPFYALSRKRKSA